MIARAALNKPWLYAQAAAAVRGLPISPDPTLNEQRELMLHHFELVRQRFGDEKASVLMRKYACCYAQGRPGAREFRKYVATIASPAEFFDVVKCHFPR
jgi:tRNA-dihydrouridine synthase B